MKRTNHDNERCVSRTLRKGQAAAAPPHTFDPRSKLPQLAVELFIAAIEMMDVVDDGAPLGGQPGQDQGGAGAKVPGRHPRSAETGHAPDDGHIAATGNSGP